MAAPREIKFLCVARKTDKTVLASRTHTSDKSYDFVANVNKVLGSPGWASVTTDKLSLDDGPNMFYVLIDESGRVFIAITSKAYPSRYIYGSPDGSTKGVLAELKRQVLEKLGDVSLTAGQGGLQSKASTLLKALCDEFNDLQSVDKLANVQAKVDGVRTVMQSNIQSALKNTDKIEDIDEKAVVLADSANKFKSASTGLKRNMRWRYIRMIGIFVLLAAAVLAVIIVPIVISNQNKR